MAQQRRRCRSRSDSQLIDDLSSWSPKVRYAAGDELGTRSIDFGELNQITVLANDTSASSGSRAGACYALGQIGSSISAATLGALLTDSDNYVRYMAGEAMRYLPSSSKLNQLDRILTAADTTSQPLFPIVEEDPLHLAHSRLAMLLFYSGSVYGPKGIIWNSVDGVDRNRLYPAIRAVADNPVGQARSTLQQTYQNLNYNDVLTLSGTIVDSVVYAAPADAMFRQGVRAGGVATLYKYDIAEGVPAGMIYAEETTWGNRIQAFERLGDYRGSVYDVTPDPGAVAFLESYVDDSTVGPTVQNILAEIEADTNPTPLTALKNIQSVTADNSIVVLPDNSTVLRVTGYDHAQGDSIYTWRKVSGPGEVNFSPNGNAAAANSTVQFDGTPGNYEFEVTMSDSRELTEDNETIAVRLIKDCELMLAEMAKEWLNDTSATGAIVNPVQPEVTPVPPDGKLVINGDFQTIVKPDTTIPATINDGDYFSIGNQTMHAGATAAYADGTEGSGIELPGWVVAGGSNTNADCMQGGTWGGPDGSGDMAFLCFANYGGPTVIESTAPLSLPVSGLGGEYELSADVYHDGGPVILELLVDGVAIEPDTESTPAMVNNTWVEFTRTFSSIPAGDVKIRVGTRDDEGTGWTGNRSSVDNVALTLTADPEVSSVDVGPDMVTWSGEPVQMNPEVVYNDTNDPPQTPLVYNWTAEPVSGFDVNISEPATEAPTVTITITGEPATNSIELQLAVNTEGSSAIITDKVTIDVYEDSCQLAKTLDPDVISLTDYNIDCITNLADFAILARDWLMGTH